MRVSKLSKKQKAHSLSKGVEVEGISRKAIYYTVPSGSKETPDDEYGVTLYPLKRLMKWTCTCTHGSLHPGGEQGNKCSHILAVEIRQEKEGGKITW